MKKQIDEYLVTHSLLSPFQSGFRKNHSTTSALLRITDDIRKSMDKKLASILVLLDFSKAFDSVNHRLICHKLKSKFHFDDSSVGLIYSYLSCRLQYTFICGIASQISAVLSGVPQGSVLGPLLFSLFINDIPSCFTSSICHMFADDVQFYNSLPLSHIEAGIVHMNSELRLVSLWARNNGLQINAQKSQAIIIYKSRVDTSLLPQLILDNSPIVFSDKVMNLGLTMNSSLTWDDHISVIGSRVYGTLRGLWKFVSVTPLSSRIKLARALLIPHFLYCDVVLSFLDSSCRMRINVIFNSCVRYVKMLKRYDHISAHVNIILGCHLNDYLKFRMCFYLFKIIHFRQPGYLFCKITLAISERTHNIIQPRHHSLQYYNSFFVYASCLWNALPSEIKRAHTVQRFRRACMDHFCQHR